MVSLAGFGKKAAKAAAKAARKSTKVAQKTAKAAAKKADNAAKAAVKRADEVAKAAAKQADDVAKAAAKKVDDALEAAAKKADDVAKAAAKKADDAAEAAAKKADEAAELGTDTAKAAAKKADDAAEAAAKQADEAAGIAGKLKKGLKKGGQTLADNKKAFAKAALVGASAATLKVISDNIKRQEEDIAECQSVCFPINWDDYIADPAAVTIKYNTLAFAKENDDDPPGDKSWEETLFCKDPMKNECTAYCTTGCETLHKRDILPGALGDTIDALEEVADRTTKKAFDKMKEAGEGLLKGMGIDPGMFKYIMWGAIAFVIFMVIKMFI